MVQSNVDQRLSIEHDYPNAWAFDALLTSGASVLIRPIRPSDAPLIVKYGDILAPHFVLSSDTAIDAAEKLQDADYSSRMAFVVIASEEIIGVANYDRADDADPSAEFVCDVAEPYRQQGVATLLFESLAAYARAQGIQQFLAEVTEDNQAMVGVFRGLGLKTDSFAVGNLITFDIDLRPTPEYRATCDEREAIAEAASMTAVLRPRVIAVVGAGRTPGSPGHEVVRSLLAGDVAGTVYTSEP